MAAPKRELFKAAEVCEVAEVQPFVLRSWEAEFPQLGQTPSEGGPRVYRRADIELVLRIKGLVFDEGLTLAGARRRLVEVDEPKGTSSMKVEELLGARARERVKFVREGLKSLLELLSTEPQGELMLVAPAPTAKRPSKGGTRSKSRGA